MRVCLMIEGQEDVSWEGWLALAAACEEAGLEGLFRSDHYLSVAGRSERGAFDAWATLAAIAARTERIRIGTLVSPATFRHPSVLAKMGATVDHVSGGRVEVGLGAGWHEAEHVAYGFDFPGARVRMSMLAEQLEVVHSSWTQEAFTFEGEHYRLRELTALPRPVQRPHPPLILGGHAGPVSAALAARWADEYNMTFATPEEYRERRSSVERACREQGRDPATLTFSLMTGCLVGGDREQLLERAGLLMRRSGRTGDAAAWLAGLRGGWIAGTVDEVAERLAALEDAGVERVMLQHLLHEDVEMVHLLGSLARDVR